MAHCRIAWQAMRHSSGESTTTCCNAAGESNPTLWRNWTRREAASISSIIATGIHVCMYAYIILYEYRKTIAMRCYSPPGVWRRWRCGSTQHFFMCVIAHAVIIVCNCVSGVPLLPLSGFGERRGERRRVFVILILYYVVICFMRCTRDPTHDPTADGRPTRNAVSSSQGTHGVASDSAAVRAIYNACTLSFRWTMRLTAALPLALAACAVGVLLLVRSAGGWSRALAPSMFSTLRAERNGTHSLPNAAFNTIDPEPAVQGLIGAEQDRADINVLRQRASG